MTVTRIQLSSRSYSVSDVDRLLKSSEMEIQPKYQRRRSPWPLSAKTALVDTILNNFPIPPIYLRDFVDKDGKRKKEIIDGQQRISTIREFYNSEFKLGRNLTDKELSGCAFETLPEEERLLFEEYEIPFLSIRGATDADIISIFTRLNSFSLPLNAQELRNSKFAGAFKTLVYQLASDYNKFWISSGVLSENQIARMADALLVSELLSTVLNGFNSTQTPVLNKVYADLDESFPEKDAAQENFNRVMPIMVQLYDSTHIRAAFKAKYMFFSLFIAVYGAMFGLHTSHSRGMRTIKVDETKEKLEDFSLKYNRGDFSQEIINKFKQATNNVDSRKFRNREISKLIVA